MLKLKQGKTGVSRDRLTERQRRIFFGDEHLYLK